MYYSDIVFHFLKVKIISDKIIKIKNYIGSNDERENFKDKNWGRI